MATYASGIRKIFERRNLSGDIFTTFTEASKAGYSLCLHNGQVYVKARDKGREAELWVKTELTIDDFEVSTIFKSKGCGCDCG